MKLAVFFLFLGLVCLGHAQRQLIKPDPEACRTRVQHSSTVRGGHHYFFSWLHAPTVEHRRDWLDARNICRKHCQDLVSLETPEEARFIENAIREANISYIWTSGRKCNFDGCHNRADLQPPIVNGWFWSGSAAKIPSTELQQGWRGDWSHTGGSQQPQPDNREFGENGNDEACIAVLNNFYGDGIKWHDVACHHTKPWVCEDSQELLNFARGTNPNLRIP